MIVLAVLAAQYAGTLDLVDTTRIDSRAADPAATVQVAGRPEKVVLAADASTSGIARLHVGDRRWDYTLTYAPSLILPDLELAFDDVGPGIKDPVELQAGTIAVGWHDVFTSVTVLESGSIGTVTTALPYAAQGAGQAGGLGSTATMAPSGTNGPTGGTGPATNGNQGVSAGQTTLLPGSKQIWTGSSNTAAFATRHFGRRITATVNGGYALNGGLTDPSRAFLPQQFGPSAGFSTSYVVSKEDSVSTAASGQETITRGACVTLLPQQTTDPTLQCRTDTYVAQIQEVVRRQLSRVSTLAVGIGVGAADFDPGTGRKLALTPAGGVAWNDRFGTAGTTTLTVSAQLTPVVDLFTGEPSERVQFLTVLTRPISPHVTVIATAGLLRALPGLPYDDKFPITALSGGLEAKVRVSTALDVSVGEQEYWQDQPGFGTPQSASLGYVSVTGRASTLHF